MKKTDYRVERDSIGVKDIPEDVYYGVQMLTCRKSRKFPHYGAGYACGNYGQVACVASKKAAAITNCEVGLL